MNFLPANISLIFTNKYNIDMLGMVNNIAREAGKITLEYYDNKDIKYKADESPLTLADIKSDEYIRSELSKHFDIPIISEESPVDFVKRKNWKEFFLVDPLDGTKEFINKNGEFTVNIALIQDKHPVMGVIYAPATGEIYYASRGKGAFMEKKGVLTELNSTSISREKTIATASRSHMSDIDQEFFELNNISEFKPAGSSLKFCSVASGEADIYPRFQGSMEWDIAAGHIIAKEAGCGVIDLSTGKEPAYNKESMLNNYFIVYSSKINYEKFRFPDRG